MVRIPNTSLHMPIYHSDIHIGRTDLSVHQQINGWRQHTMDYYLVIERNEALSFAQKLMELEDIMSRYYIKK